MVDSELLVDSWFQDIFSKKNTWQKFGGEKSCRFEEHMFRLTRSGFQPPPLQSDQMGLLLQALSAAACGILGSWRPGVLCFFVWQGDPGEQPPLFAEDRNSLGLDTFFSQKPKFFMGWWQLTPICWTWNHPAKWGQIMLKPIWDFFSYFADLFEIHQLMVNCWFGARWFGFRLDPRKWKETVSYGYPDSNPKPPIDH